MYCGVPSGTTASCCGAAGVPCTVDVVGMIASSDLDVLRTSPSSSDLDVLGTAPSSSDLDVLRTAPSSCHLVDAIGCFSFCFAFLTGSSNSQLW